MVARQGTFLYQATRFARRNRLRLAVVAAMLLTILFGVNAWISAGQAEREKQVVQSLSTLFEHLQNLDPRAGEDPAFAGELRQLVARNVDAIELADILNEQADTLEDQGGFRTAEILYREALDMGTRLVGREHAAPRKGGPARTHRQDGH